MSLIIRILRLALTLLATIYLTPAAAQIAVGVSIRMAPPALPVYVQPPMPAPGYLWTPGYWAYGDSGYYWVPGTWVQPPSVGVLWTPPWWGWSNGLYLWHAGYWGPHVGFYGGVNYGFGYGGVGYLGGMWVGAGFRYNSSVNNFGGNHVTNVYHQTIVNNSAVSRVSFNGGAGGVQARPGPAEIAAEHEQHVPPTPVQGQHQQAASGNRALLASENHGRPAVAATARPGEFSGPHVAPARGAGVTAANHPNGGSHPAQQPHPQAGQPHEHGQRHPEH